MHMDAPDSYVVMCSTRSDVERIIGHKSYTLLDLTVRSTPAE